MEKKLQKRTVVKLLKNWKENGKKYDNCTKQEERIFKDKNKIITKTEKITELQNTRRKREKIIAGGSKNKKSRKGKMTKEQYDSETNTTWQSKKKKQ